MQRPRQDNAKKAVVSAPVVAVVVTMPTVARTVKVGVMLVAKPLVLPKPAVKAADAINHAANAPRVKTAQPVADNAHKVPSTTAVYPCLTKHRSKPMLWVHPHHRVKTNALHAAKAVVHATVLSGHSGMPATTHRVPKVITKHSKRLLPLLHLLPKTALLAAATSQLQRKHL